MGWLGGKINVVGDIIQYKYMIHVRGGLYTMHVDYNYTEEIILAVIFTPLFDTKATLSKLKAIVPYNAGTVVGSKY